MNSQGGASHDPQVRPQTQPRCRPATIGELLQSQLRSQDSARQDVRGGRANQSRIPFHARSEA